MKKISWLLIVTLLVTFPLAGAAYGGNEEDVAPEESQLEYYGEALAEIMEFLMDTFDGAVEEETLLDGALRGLLEALGDPHSVYMDEEEVEEFFASVDGRFGGIGASLELVDGYPMIIAVFPHTPAGLAGLAPGDLIVEVDGEDIKDHLLSSTVSRIRGEPGTEVTLKVYRPSTDQTFPMTLVRAVIEIPSLDYRALDDHLAYVRIHRFGETTARDMEVVAGFIQATQVGGVVVDVRGNPGGYLSTTLEVSDMLTPVAPLLRISGRDGEEQVFYGSDPGWGIPLVVLVDGRTTSGAEILAAAVQDTGSGVVMGHEGSFGKGSVQDMFWLNNGGAIKLTTAHFYSPDGHPIHGEGVTPDILVEQPVLEAIPFVEECGPGSSRAVVGEVQLALNQLGYDSGVVDGLYGPITTRAVAAFQEASGLETTGLVDPETVMVMQEEISNLHDTVLQEAIRHLRDCLGM